MNAEMSTDSSVEVETMAAGDADSEVQLRLAQIAAAMKERQGDGAAAKGDLPDGMACPIDPAERALCEGCQ